MKTRISYYGMGISQIPFGNRIAYGYSGGIDGFEAELIYFSEGRLAMAYCCNGLVYPVNDILATVVNICSHKEDSVSLTD